MSKSNGWIAVRKGDVYCSPACGGGCTYADFLSAIEKGDRLAARCGRGFTRRITENLGWHFCAVSKSGRLEVSEYAARTFNASLEGRFGANGTTPKKAIQGAMEEVRKLILYCNTLLEEEGNL